MLFAKAMRLAQMCRQLRVVVAHLGEHIHRRDEISVVVEDALQTSYVPDGAQRHAADLANTLGDRVGGGEDLIGMLVKQEMVVAKVRSRHVPVKILRFQVQREHIRKKHIERTGNVLNGLRFQVRTRLQRSGAQCLGVSRVHLPSPWLAVSRMLN